MEPALAALLAEARAAAPALASRPDFEAFKARYVGPKGSFTGSMKIMGTLPPAEKPAAGRLINQFKQEFEKLFAETLARLDAAAMTARLGPRRRPHPPRAGFRARPPAPAHAHAPRGLRALPQSRLHYRRGAGTGNRVVQLRRPQHARPTTPRATSRTLFISPMRRPSATSPAAAHERYLLRSHTSTVQIRTLLKEKPPLRILAPGRVFRRDNVDATHSANFHQVEGLCVDQRVTVVDLKAALDYLVRGLFGAGAQIRLRPSFFPFTEPSFEMDFTSPDLGKLSGKWLELGGCGVVDPEVFKAVGLDPAEWTGYAFGFGLERIAMVRAGLDDIRHFYQNDLRFLRQFA